MKLAIRGRGRGCESEFESEGRWFAYPSNVATVDLLGHIWADSSARGTIKGGRRDGRRERGSEAGREDGDGAKKGYLARFRRCRWRCSALE